MERYREWEQRLVILRTRTNGHYSLDEDRIVDEMTAAWELLTTQEQAQLDAEGPRAPNRLAVESADAVVARGGWPSPRDVRPFFSLESQWSFRAITYLSQAVNRGVERWSEPIIVDAPRVRELPCT